LAADLLLINLVLGNGPDLHID